MIEEWRPIPGFKRSYAVSNLGRVRSLDRTVIRSTARGDGQRLVKRKGKVLKPNAHAGGYRFVKLSGVSFYIHLLVLDAFVGKRPKGKIAGHADGDRANNRASNLEWRKKTSGNEKLTEAKVRAIRALEGKLPHRKIAARYGVKRSTVSNIISGNTWGAS